MKSRKIALVGNPNTGKTSLFNLLTGMNQHVGNFPGVTVDKKTGSFRLPDGQHVSVLDLPGTYSLFPRSLDERVVFDILSNPSHPDHPEIALVIADSSNLERNLLLYTQISDLGIPCMLVLTMTDVAKERQLLVDYSKLQFHLGNVPVFAVNGRTGEGLEDLKAAIGSPGATPPTIRFGVSDLRRLIDDAAAQVRDTEWRFARIREILRKVQEKPKEAHPFAMRSKLDKLAVHPVWGYVIFVAILLLVFQLIFRFAEYPMNWLDGFFLTLSQSTKAHLPSGMLTDLLAEGVIPGVGGVLVFIPQIALLIFLLGLLEESGYMARVVFLMDKLVRPFGLNGKSVVPLVSSVACAIPGIMATRTISSWKDRLVTIMVAPLMSCSARIPVFTLLIALVVPDGYLWGFIDAKGAVLFGLYALGLISAMAMAWVFKKVIRSKERSFLLMEMPPYQWPRLKQLALNVREKVTVFVVDAGKVILAISVVLWALCSYGPGDRMEQATARVQQSVTAAESEEGQVERDIASARLENSYMGILGRTIEPVIAPLGYDWKIGIALLTSFAAREVFVGSMAAIYSVGEDFESDDTLIDRLHKEVNPVTGKPVYTLASGFSLMIFYVFAMQCMSTLAVVKRETKSWKWPIIQMVYMGILAYLSAFAVFHWLS